MRVPESAIRAAILFPEEEVRVAAVSFFSGSFSRDEAIMPLVIESIQRHGRAQAFRLLRSAERLRQTEATVGWLIDELRQDYELVDVCQDNYRFAVALILGGAAPEILGVRQDEILALPMFPDPLRVPLLKRLEMSSWSWERGWAALEALGYETMRKGKFAWNDIRYADCLVESLARHATTRAEFVADALEQRREEQDGSLLEWLKPCLIHLAGTIRLQAVIPTLLRYLTDDNLSVADESTTALIRINTDAVVSAIAHRWPAAEPAFRAAASDVLEHIHNGYCAETCLHFFETEDDLPTKTFLGHTVLSQFLEEGIEPVRRFVLDGEPSPSRRDLRYRLVVACTAMQRTFPEYDQWRQAAIEDNWGLGDYQPPRLADSFRPDGPVPKRTQDGRKHGYL